VFDTRATLSAAIALVSSAPRSCLSSASCSARSRCFAGGLGLFEAWLVPRVGGARLAASCIGFGFLIAGAQVLLFRFI
jgi:hypothetical protein